MRMTSTSGLFPRFIPALSRPFKGRNVWLETHWRKTPIFQKHYQHSATVYFTCSFGVWPKADLGVWSAVRLHSGQPRLVPTTGRYWLRRRGLFPWSVGFMIKERRSLNVPLAYNPTQPMCGRPAAGRSYSAARPSALRGRPSLEPSGPPWFFYANSNGCCQLLPEKVRPHGGLGNTRRAAKASMGARIALPSSRADPLGTFKRSA